MLHLVVVIINLLHECGMLFGACKETKLVSVPKSPQGHQIYRTLADRKKNLQRVKQDADRILAAS